MPCDGRGHAQSRIGIDIRRADESLHQLVCHVIVLRQQLTGDVKGNRVRTVLIDDATEFVRDQPESIAPGDAFATNLRMQQTPVQSERFTERRSFGTQSATISGMIGIAGNLDFAIRVTTCENPTTHTAVWASRACEFVHLAKAAPN